MPPHTLTTAFLSCGLLLATGSPLAASPAAPIAAPVSAPVTAPAAAPAVLGGPLALVAHDPPRHARDLPTHGIVRLTFDQPLDFSTVGPDSIEVMGLWSGVTDVRYIPADGGRTLILTPRQPFFPGEQVTVQVTTLLQGTSGAALPEGGQMLQYWVAPAPGSLEFVREDIVSTRLPGESLVRSYGIHAADLDGDGAPDFSIPNEVSDDVRVIPTDGCGNLLPIEVHPLNQGDTPSANAMLDMDDDGDLDFAVCGWAGDRVNLLEGDGSGDFAPMVSYRAGDVPRGIAAVDVEGDGDTDLVLAHRTSSDLGLMRNLGGGTFGPVTMFEGGGDGETALVAADMDNDGLWDLVVAHYLSYEASVLHGDGTGAFTVVDVDPVGTRPWMIVAGDLDGDGQLDAATCNSGSSNASVLRGTPAGGLQNDQLLPLGHFSVAIDLADMDGDGDLDFVNSSFSSQLWRVHENDGTGTFASSFDLPATLAASCATLVDYDRDGFVDLVGMDELSDEIHLWRQQAVTPVGVQPASCEATMRIDNLAHGAGFGAQAPREVSPGEGFHIGVSAGPGVLYGVLAGTPRPVGEMTSSGLLNLEPGWTMFIIRGTDAAGEDTRLYTVPNDVPVGFDVALQVIATTAAGHQLSNPHVLRVVP